MFRKIPLVAILFLLIGCAATRESPTIYFSNLSAAPVKDIQCVWAGSNVLTLAALNPGDSRAQSFYIRGSNKFFGEVNVSWRNIDGEKLVKNFVFRKIHLPNIDDNTTYSYVQFYFDQDELEVLSSDSPDLNGKIKKMERLLAKFSSDFKQRDPAVQTSLIRVQPKHDTSMPNWLSTSY